MTDIIRETPGRAGTGRWTGTWTAPVPVDTGYSVVSVLYSEGAKPILSSMHVGQIWGHSFTIRAC